MLNSTIVEGKSHLHVLGLASIVPEDREVAWEGARSHITVRPDIGWVMGRYVHADTPNENGHIFGLKDLQKNHHLVVNTQTNMLHRIHHSVGTYVASELIYPVGQESAVETADALSADPATPWVETLAAFWRYAYPQEWSQVKAAFDDGSLWSSMEAVPDSLTCPACGMEAAYAGTESTTYCDHMNEFKGKKVLVNPHFVGGAYILPPARPGWKRADVKEIAALVEQIPDVAEELYNAVAEASPHLSSLQWEEMMGALMLRTGPQGRRPAKTVRKSLASAGVAMADGTWRIASVAELKNALAAYKRGMSPDAGAKHKLKDGDKVRAHILSRANNLHSMDLVKHLLDPESAADDGAEDGFSLPDGSYPIPDEAHLKKAIQAYGRARPSDRSKVKAHIISRARALGLDSLIPDKWVNATAADHSGSAMVAITPPPDVAAQLAALGNEDPSDIHMTILYLGSLDSISIESLNGLYDGLQEVAADLQPFPVSFNGAGRFSNPDGVATWIAPDSRVFPQLRSDVEDAAEEANIPLASEHGFTPHITVAWGDAPDAPLPIAPDSSFVVSELELHLGGEIITIPLGGDESDLESDSASVKTIPVGTHVSWVYRSGTGHGTVAGVAKLGTSSANTLYELHQMDNHVGPTGKHEPKIVKHYGSDITVVG